MKFQCVLCQTVQVILYALPPVCPKCKAKAHWRSCDEDPAVDYKLSRNDEQFLKSVKIDPE